MGSALLLNRASCLIQKRGGPDGAVLQAPGLRGTTTPGVFTGGDGRVLRGGQVCTLPAVALGGVNGAGAHNGDDHGRDVEPPTFHSSDMRKHRAAGSPARVA